ncbi:hypothetical protein GCM10009530_01670 [Microbispora corallina]|uniref:Uncharacterized protein n=1 Tax=Microbispora corallina TaxID=83302 RepID=A0ABQ4FS12_9ACTN|nr:hypothetical protein [Microbispora corallina]GIH37605.1 hypothetical protein Mco01_06050 [Microbispora corallina]
MSATTPQPVPDHPSTPEAAVTRPPEEPGPGETFPEEAVAAGEAAAPRAERTPILDWIAVGVAAVIVAAAVIGLLPEVGW